jgi:aquaporin Z
VTAQGAKLVDEIGWFRRGLAEFVGTFLLTFVAAGGEVISVVSHGEVSASARAVAPGLVVAALIYAIGDVSGAHFNPVVTLAFAVRRVFSRGYVPLYWATQIAGACAAATVLRTLFGLRGDLGTTAPSGSDEQALVLEIVLSGVLVFVIVSTATRHSLVGNDTALAVGATVALCGLFAGPISGASMNPARSLGPALIAGSTGDVWIYLAGPIVGGLVAVLVCTALHPHRTRGEHEAAEGDCTQ